MTAEVFEGWEGFFVAEAGAAAALAGLLFVAVSINLARILEFPHLPLRIVEALLAFVTVLVVATIGLTPHQTAEAYGAEIAAAGLVVWAGQTAVLLRGRALGHGYGRFDLRVLFNQSPPLIFVVAGVLIFRGAPTGPLWLTPGVLAAFATGLAGAWVLMIEVHR
jgi:modulator of FtsH protease